MASRINAASRGIYAFQVNAVADKKELVGKDTIGLVEVSIAAFIDARAAALAALRAAEDNKDHIGVRGRSALSR